MAAHPEPYVHHPEGQHKSTLILLHGTSSTGPEFAQDFLNYSFAYPHSPTQNWTFPQLFPDTRFVFPTGSEKKLTVLGGVLKHAWFDIHSFADRTIGEEDQIRDMKESANYLSSLVRSENALLSSGKVVLLGFSQGSAMGVVMLLAGLLDIGIEAFIGLSGWLPFRAQIEDALSKGSRSSAQQYIRSLLQLHPLPSSPHAPRIWLGHGALDTKVKLEWAEQMSEILPRAMGEGMSIELEKNVYQGLAHWWNEEEMAGIVEFLGRVWLPEG